jgi:hypothetical protein
MKPSSRISRSLGTGIAVASAAILLPAAALAASAASGTPGRVSAGPARPAATPSWKVVKTVRGSGNLAFTAVTATSRHSAWAFEATSSKPVAWRLSGSRWTRASFPGMVGETVVSVASTSADDVWAASNGTRSRVLSWNGRTWAVTGSFPVGLGDVVPLSRRDAWVFGSGRAWRYNGHHWSRVRSGNGLSYGSALSPGSIWAIGVTDVAHWNGRTWSRTSVARLLPTCREHLCSPSLSSIYAQSPTSVWAVGTGNRQDIQGPTVLLHFNGHRWRRAALNDTAGNPGQVIPDGTAGLWISNYWYEAGSRMLHYSAGHLRLLPLPAISGRTLQVQAMAAVPGVPRAIGVGTTFPTKGGAYQTAVILAYRS